MPKMHAGQPAAGLKTGFSDLSSTNSLPLYAHCRPELSEESYSFTLRSEHYCHPPTLPLEAGQWRMTVPAEEAVVRRFPDRRPNYGHLLREPPPTSFLPNVWLDLRDPEVRQHRPLYWEYAVYLSERGCPVPFNHPMPLTRPEYTLAKLQAAEQRLALQRPADAAPGQQGGEQRAAAAAAQQRGQAVPVQQVAALPAQPQARRRAARQPAAAAGGGVAIPVQAVAAVALQEGAGMAVPVQAVVGGAPQQGGGVAVAVQAAADPEGHAVEVQPSASQPSQATMWQPAEPPGETARHNAAVRQQQRRRDSIDSLTMPESREWMANQQAAGLADNPPSVARRGLLFNGSPAAARAPAPGSAAQRRPPLPRGHPAAPGDGMGLLSPNRLGSLSDFSARKGLQPSPSPLRPAAGARLHMASPQVLPSASQQRYAQSPAAAAHGLAAASPAQQRQRQVQQQLLMQSPAAAGTPTAAAASPELQQTLPAQQAQQTQQANNNWKRYGRRLAAHLEQLPIQPYAPASPAAAAAGRASSYRMAERGDVLLHCPRTKKGTGLPELQQVLVLGVSLGTGSPKRR